MPKLKQFKIARRLGARVFPKTENPKFVITPKMRTRKHRTQPLTEFGTQLLEKQKARYYYGVRERQFGNYVKKASAKKGSNPAQELYRLLESRLDNTVFRLGFAQSRALGRQLVSHGHIMVNDRKVSIPSYSVRPGDRIAIRLQSRDKSLFLTLAERIKDHTPPQWLSRTETFGAVVKGAPAIDKQQEMVFNITSIIEFYSR
ncbi:MAG: 30S ribosomal protein S4 [Parcubacteria group bacterium]|nr:30S ribosomal protein S4 [Parcubacteria group bacterium]